MTFSDADEATDRTELLTVRSAGVPTPPAMPPDGGEAPAPATGQHRNALASGTELLWYRIERVLGHGAFGITYYAIDTNLQRAVAIKEYLPGQFARREADATVQPFTDDLESEYIAGLKSFVSEARTLARFEHPSIVRVHNVFEANRTAYMVMQYEEGESLDRILKRTGTLPESELLRLLDALLDGLEVIHARGFIHRDIKPANVFLRADGTPVLLDFGSARQAQTGEARTLTNFVSPGYAPIEQYIGRSDQQGPWSDLYGLAATVYRAMTGCAPTDAIERSRAIAHDARDALQACATLAPQGYSAELTAGVERALQFRVGDRPQSVAEWRRLLPLPDADAATEPATGVWTVPVAAVAAATAGADATRLAALARVPMSWLPVRYRTPAAVAFVTVVALALGFMIARPRQPVSEAPTQPPVVADRPVPQPHAQTPVAPPVEPAVPAAAPAPAPAVETAVTTPPATNSIDAAAQRRDRIAELYLGASKDFEAQRLTTPPGQNAYEKYREILRLEPGQRAAQDGIDGIADRYLQFMYRELGRDDFARAEAYLHKAESVAPARRSVVEARDTLETHRRAMLAARAPATSPPASADASTAADEAAPAPAPQGFFHQIGNLFKRQSRSAPAPIEDRSAR